MANQAKKYNVKTATATVVYTTTPAESKTLRKVAKSFVFRNLSPPEKHMLMYAVGFACTRPKEFQLWIAGLILYQEKEGVPQYDQIQSKITAAY